MNEDDYKSKLESAKCREKRYQWVITTILSVAFLLIGFLGGLNYQAMLMKDRVTANTVKIERIEKSLEKIDEKLDRILAERRTQGTIFNSQ